MINCYKLSDKKSQLSVFTTDISFCFVRKS